MPAHRWRERLHRAAPSALMLGEDLAWGTGSDAQPEAIVQAWMDSPPHRWITLDCRFLIASAS